MKFAKAAAPAIATALAVAVAGCGGSTKTVTAPAPATQAPAATATPSATASAMTKEQAAHAYLTAVAPADAIGKAFFAKAKAWPDSTSGSQAASDAKPYVQAITDLRTKLLDLAKAYPAAATDLKAMVNANAPVQGDLAGLANVDGLSESSWGQQFATDASKMSSAIDIVRSDLGLPAAPTIG
jgi:hypothetical protein